MKDNTVYNQADNEVYVKTHGDEIHVICKTENQMNKVVKRLTTDNCKLAGYEEWDEGEFPAIKVLRCGRSKNGLRNFMPLARAGLVLPLGMRLKTT